MNSGKEDGITVLVDSLIGLYALEPIILELTRRNIDIEIYCREKNIDRIAEILQLKPERFHSLEPLIESKRPLFYLHRFLRQIFTRRDFSFQHRLLSDPRQFPGDWRYWITAMLARMLPGLPNHRVNQALQGVIRPLIRNHFPTKKLLTISRSSLPHLLCARGLEVTTVLESWDHPVKWPVGHLSHSVLTWNEDLASDWRRYQGDRNVYAVYPLKMRYWLERNLSARPLGKRRTAVYAVGTSSMSYVNSIHRYELMVIDAVAQATLQAGWDLLIKPKPNGKGGDFDDFATRYRHISLGVYSDVETPTDYYLDDEYNRQRELELSKGDLLINSITTFAFDAALGGLPCLQLDLRRCLEYRGVAEGQANHHLERYLLSDPHLCLVAEPGCLIDQLANYLRHPDNRAEQLRDRLRAWLQPNQSLNRSVDKIVDHLLEKEEIQA